MEAVLDRLGRAEEHMLSTYKIPLLYALLHGHANCAAKCKCTEKKKLQVIEFLPMRVQMRPVHPPLLPVSLQEGRDLGTWHIRRCW